VKKRITREEAARRVFEVYKANTGSLLPITTVARRAKMTTRHVRIGDRVLKSYLRDKTIEGGWHLHINMGPDSGHGLIQDGDEAVINAFPRSQYMRSRSRSELDYRKQQVDRVQDALTKKQLRAGIVYFEAGVQAFEDADERLRNGA
jgi:hypothetical protein